ncbi:hypothetical protein CEXT_802621 [Caerostris extrusa]|uniref:Uncharacterized protein n=1 Tax=Caerostris extrusa TaxID=172846 RepID=A0AAV4X6L1_CAEEX|nr:hypothetical protein CEXT_802621 [Caerostris extrusa]
MLGQSFANHRPGGRRRYTKLTPHYLFSNFLKTKKKKCVQPKLNKKKSNQNKSIKKAYALAERIHIPANRTGRKLFGGLRNIPSKLVIFHILVARIPTLYYVDEISARSCYEGMLQLNSKILARLHILMTNMTGVVTKMEPPSIHNR